MAKAKCWYKNIKPGDVLEFKMGPKHVMDGCETNLVEIERLQDTHFIGHYIGGTYNGLKGMVIADFTDPDLKWNDIQFIRKIKSSQEKEA